MSSVQTKVECPQCKRQADAVFNTRSREEWISCGHCGYLYETKIHQSKHGSATPRYSRRETLGCGSARYQTKTGIGYQRFSFHKNKRGRYVQWVLDNAESLIFATMTIQQADGDWREVALLGEVLNDQDIDDSPIGSEQGGE